MMLRWTACSLLLILFVVAVFIALLWPRYDYLPAQALPLRLTSWQFSLYYSWPIENITAIPGLHLCR
jgi:hypothetical protein